MSTEYYKNKDTVKSYIQAAKDVNGAELIKELKKQLSPAAKILEIGSGPGSDWEILSKDFDVVGSDNSDAFVDHLKQSYPKGKFVNLDAIKMNVDDTFDAIYSNKVLHHLSPEELKVSIPNQVNILNEKGILCHSFWNGTGSEVFNGMFVQYYSVNEVRNLFEPQFHILSIESYQEFEEDDSLLMIAELK